MRALLYVAAIVGFGALVFSTIYPHQADASYPTTAWNLEHSRSPDSIGWPAQAGRSDYWTGHRDALSVRHPSGREIAFANVDFTAQRERGQLTSIRLSQRGLSHAQMLERSRAFCDTWNWPATAARVLAVYPNSESVKSAPRIWLAQTRGVCLRITHDGPGKPDSWNVECDFNLRPK